MQNFLFPWQHAQFKRLQALASNARLAHAWIFSGVAGIGKQNFAQFFSQYLLCKQVKPEGPCGQCQDCHLFRNGTHPDWLLLQPEEKYKQLKVDLIRDAIGFAQHTAQRSGAKVIMIQPAEAMNHNATNALLKMLEEPPPATFLFLLTEQPSVLLATLRSRCQLLTLHAPDQNESLAYLKQANLNSDDAKHYLVLAQGAPLLAQELAQQGALDDFSKLIQALEKLVQGHSTPVQIAKLSEHLGVRAVIEYQLLGLKNLLVALQTATKPALPMLNMLFDYFHQQHSIALVRRMHQLMQRLLTDRRTALAVNNANGLLMAEALYAEWAAIMPKRSKQ